MKKKFTGIILAIMMITMSVFTGCSLITTNWEKYYNAVVDTIVLENGEKIEITKRELISAYNSYGYYFEQYNQERPEAIDSTLKQLESRKLVIHTAKEKFTQENGYVFDDKEKTYLWQQTNDALEDNFFTYVNQVTGTSNGEDEEDEEVIKFKGYEKQGDYNFDTKKVEKSKALDQLLADFNYDASMKKDIEIKEDKNLIYQNLLKLANSENGGKIYSEAFSEYRKALKKSEEGLNIKDNKDVDLFTREIDRIYKINEENYLVEKYTDSFKSKTKDSNVTVEKMLDLYSKQVLNSYTQYVREEDEDYEEDVLSDLSKINYFKTGDNATKFYTVSHILFKYSDKQTQDLKTAEKDLKSGKIEYADYKARVDEINASIVPVVRKKDSKGIYTEVEIDENINWNELGLEGFTISGDKISVTDVYTYINRVISNISDPIQKAEKFNEFIYIFNQDPGIMNAEYNYVMGVNKSQADSATGDDLITLEDGRKYKKYSKMVQEFTLAGTELFNDGRGQIGDLSQPVLTENGYHVLMYTGACVNLFDSIIHGYENGQTNVLSNSAIETLYTTRLNVCVDKTIFDKLYDILNVDNFSSLENANISLLREKCTFYPNESQLKDLKQAK